MVKPNFFIIGAPKCGTTALSEYLRLHPNVFFSTPKEPWYFNFDLDGFQKKSLEDYLSLFLSADPALHQAVGEGTVSYLFSQRAVPEILKFNPDAKFIVMLRNPVEMVQALHSQRIFNGLEDIADFEEAWRAEGDRRNGKKIPFSCFNRIVLFYSEWAQYGDQVERLFALVPRERVRIILFEDFAADTKKVYEETLAFLGLPADHRRDFPKVNENKRMPFPLVARIRNWVSHFLVPVKRKLGITLKLRILGRLAKFNYGPAARKPISENFKSELKKYYFNDIQKLSALLGKDLSSWVSDGLDETGPEGRKF